MPAAWSDRGRHREAEAEGDGGCRADLGAMREAVEQGEGADQHRPERHRQPHRRGDQQPRATTEARITGSTRGSWMPPMARP